MNQLKSIFSARNSDIFLAAAVISIIGAMIVPLPPWLLDTLIAINLAAGATLLVAALYARDALKVASFPTLLLITTLFRLALNVSSTRLALLEAHAGDVIQAFGEFIIQGEYVVGGVIFAILTLVQFLVVAKGAERVAEVGARFTLDAMPGKQMAIDADLRSGAIDLDGAKSRRRALERESQLYGAMDGAMKFVKGDAIAGLIIVLINAVGGLIIGVMNKGMAASEAAKIYTLLAIGDGLVSQIPALCIAIAAGLVVTRVAGEDESGSLGADIGSQFLSSPRALGVVAALLLLLGLMPLMPKIPFLALAGGCAAGAHFLAKRGKREKEERQKATIDQQLGTTSDAAPASKESPSPAAGPAPLGAGVSPVCLDLDGSLDVLARMDENRFISRDLPALRESLYLETGVRFPGIRARGGAPLGPGVFMVLIDEIPAAHSATDPDSCLAFVDPAELSVVAVEALAVTDPVSGKTVAKIRRTDMEKVQSMGVRIREPREQMLAFLAHTLRRHAASFIGVQEVQSLLDALERTHPALVREATQKVPPPMLVDVLRRLVEEGISIRNLRAILEAVADPNSPGDPQALAERCRQALRRHLCWRFAQDGTLYAHLADPALEEVLRQAIRTSEPGSLALDPVDAAAILDGMREALRGGTSGVVLTAPDVRRYLRKLCEGSFPDLTVLTYSELNPDLQIRPLGRVRPIHAAAA